jgi:hypothetical protein
MVYGNLIDWFGKVGVGKVGNSIVESFIGAGDFGLERCDQKLCEEELGGGYGDIFPCAGE